MKKFISIVLCLVLVFSFSIPSFASEIEPQAGDHNSELDALNEISYYVYWIFQDFTEDLTSIEEWLSDIWQSLTGSDIAFKLTRIMDNTSYLASIEDWLSDIWTTLAGDDIAFKLTRMMDSLMAIEEVLADPEDVAMKESQEQNQASITEIFFTPGTDTSISTDDITGFAGSVGDFFSTFDTSEIVGDGNPLDLIGDGSDFSRWFSTENGLSMDPNFGSGIGGGGTVTPPPSSNPFQGTNVLPYATSNLVTGTIYNGTGFKNYSAFTTTNIATPERDVYSDYLSTTGYIEVSAGDTVYVVNMDFTTGSIKEFYGSELSKEIYHANGTDFTDFIASLYVDENGVFKWTVSDNSTESILAVRFESALISKATYITINEYPLKDVEPPEEPEPEPIKNWLPLATTDPGGSEIYNGKGWKTGTRWSSSSQAPTSHGDLMLSGWIPCSGSDIVYFLNIDISSSLYNQYFISFFSDSSSYSTTDLMGLVPDSSGVYSFVCPSNANYFRVCVDSFYDNSVITVNQYPIQATATASTYSLRASAPEIEYSSDIATSYYEERMNEFYNLLGGGN